MKKKLTLFLSLLCIIAMLLPTAVSALPPSSYVGEAEALRNDAFKDYQPTYSGSSFTGYPGPYTVGYFRASIAFFAARATPPVVTRGRMAACIFPAPTVSQAMAPTSAT